MTDQFPRRTAVVATITAAALLGNAGAAGAESIRLEAPLQAASLHEGSIDMVVFYLPQSDHFEVVATYVERDAAYEPARLRMGLADGDSVSFGLPGQRDVLYRFTREGSAVAVSGTPTHGSS